MCNEVNIKQAARIAGISLGDWFKVAKDKGLLVQISPDEINDELIFEDGYQGELTHHEQRTGSGKGLFFVKQVIDKHHGKIFVKSKIQSDSQEQEGQPHLNTFIIHLPYIQPEK